MTSIPSAVRTAETFARPIPWRRHALARGITLMLACGGAASVGAQSTTPLVLSGNQELGPNEVVWPVDAATGYSPGQAGAGTTYFGWYTTGARGGNGVDGGRGDTGANAGNGAAGIAAASGSYFTFTNRGRLVGGTGGKGGTGGTGGRGGNGGMGAFDPSGNTQCLVYSHCANGAPGDGGNGGNAGNGGTGGAGLTGSHFTLINSGRIKGGTGGASGRVGEGGPGGTWPSTGYIGDEGNDGVNGAGGTGVVARGYATIINTGLIAGAAGASNNDGTTRSADGLAIDFSGGANRLVLKNSDYMASIAGKVVSSSGRLNGGDTLDLGMSADSQFSLQRLQNSFIGFANLAKSGTYDLILNADNTSGSAGTFQGLTSVLEGTLKVAGRVTLLGTFGGASQAGGYAVWVTSGVTDGILSNYTPNATNSALVNAGVLQGGAGGDGSRSAAAGPAPRGGDGGISVIGFDFTLRNEATGQILGGRGGDGGVSSQGEGQAGAGGVAIRVGSGSTIVNFGTIAGGQGGSGRGGGIQANAIEMAGGGSTLSLRSSSVIRGGVVSAGGDTLDLGGSTAGSFDAGLIGSQYRGFSQFTKTGSANWTLTGNGTTSWLVQAGSLTGSTRSMAGNLGFSPLPDATATAIFNQATAGTYNGVISGNGNVVVGGGGTVTFAQANRHTGFTHLIAGQLLLSGAGSFGAGALQLAAGTVADLSAISAASTTVGGLQGKGTLVLGSKTLRVDGAADTSFSGSITGSGSLTKAGSGSFTLATANAYSGGTRVVGGSLVIGADAALGGASGGLSLDGGTLQTTATFSSARGVTLGASGGSFNTKAGSTLTLSNAISGAGVLSKSGAGTLLLSGTNSYSGGTVVQAGTLTGSTRSMAGNISFSPLPDATATATFDQATAGTYNGVISGNGHVVVGGGGTVTFTRANSHTGLTRLVAGQLLLSGAGSFGAGALQLDLGTVADISAISAGSTTVGGLQGKGTLALGGKNLRVDGAAVTSFAGTITGAGSLTKAGSGVLTLAGANAHGGGTSVLGGRLVIGADAALGAASGGLGLDGATLQTTASFSSARQIALGSHGGTFSPDTGSTLTLGGVISGAGTIDLLGGGTLVLSGSNSYAGGTRVNVGTLSIGSDANLGAATGGLSLEGGQLHITGAVVSARTLGLSLVPNVVDIDNGAVLSLSASIRGGGTLVKKGAGNLMLQGDNSGDGQLGGLVVKQGTVMVGQDSALGRAGGLTLDGGALMTSSFATSRTLTLGAAGGRIIPLFSTLQLDGAVAGSGGLTTGGGNAVLILASQANSYGGDTTVIEGGTLRLAAGSGLGNDSHALRLKGGQLALAAGASTTVGSVSITTDRAWVGSLLIGEAGSAQGSTLQVRGDLNNGNGGEVRVNNGLLAVAGSLVNTGNLTVLAGGRVNAGSFVQTAGITTLAGGLIDPPTTITVSGGTLAGSGTLEGDVQVTGGRIEVGAGGLLVTGSYVQTGGTLDFGLSFSGGQYHYGRLTATTMAVGGNLEFTLNGGSAADLQQLEVDLLANVLQPLASPGAFVFFSSVRLGSTLAGVGDVVLDGDQVLQLDRAMRTVTTVPEPAHWALLLAGLAGLAWRARRQRAGEASV